MADWPSYMRDLGDLALYLAPDRRAPHPLDIQGKRQSLAQAEQMNPLLLQEREIQNRTLAEILSQSQQSFPTTLEGAKFGLETQQRQRPWQELATSVSVGGPQAAVSYGRQNPEWAQKNFGGQQMTPPGYFGEDTQGASGQVEVPLDAALSEAGSRFYNMGPETARKITESQGILPAELAKLNPQLANLLQISRERNAALIEAARIQRDHEKQGLTGASRLKFDENLDVTGDMVRRERNKVFALLNDPNLTPDQLNIAMNDLSENMLWLKGVQERMIGQAKSANIPDTDYINRVMQENINRLDEAFQRLRAKHAEITKKKESDGIGGMLNEFGREGLKRFLPEYEPPTL